MIISVKKIDINNGVFIHLCPFYCVVNQWRKMTKWLVTVVAAAMKRWRGSDNQWLIIGIGDVKRPLTDEMSSLSPGTDQWRWRLVKHSGVTKWCWLMTWLSDNGQWLAALPMTSPDDNCEQCVWWLTNPLWYWMICVKAWQIKSMTW